MMAQVSRSQLLLARLALTTIIVLLALGLLLYGMSADVHRRIWQDLIDRPGGPMSFRFVLQPVMAAAAALHDGLHDARVGRPPYLQRLLSGSEPRADVLHEALVSTSRIILLGLVMDAIYQAIVLHSFYPGEMVVIALALAMVPYFLLRGIFTRVARFLSKRQAS